MEPGELTQQLRTVQALSEVLSLFVSLHVGSYNSLYLQTEGI